MYQVISETHGLVSTHDTAVQADQRAFWVAVTTGRTVYVEEVES